MVLQVRVVIPAELIERRGHGRKRLGAAKGWNNIRHCVQWLADHVKYQWKGSVGRPCQQAIANGLDGAGQVVIDQAVSTSDDGCVIQLVGEAKARSKVLVSGVGTEVWICRYHDVGCNHCVV